MVPVSSVAPLVTNMLLFSDLLRQAVVLEGVVEDGVRRWRRWHLAWVLLLSAVEVGEVECLPLGRNSEMVR